MGAADPHAFTRACCAGVRGQLRPCLPASRICLAADRLSPSSDIAISPISRTTITLQSAIRAARIPALRLFRFRQHYATSRRLQDRLRLSRPREFKRFKRQILRHPEKYGNEIRNRSLYIERTSKMRLNHAKTRNMSGLLLSHTACFHPVVAFPHRLASLAPRCEMVQSQVVRP